VGSDGDAADTAGLGACPQPHQGSTARVGVHPSHLNMLPVSPLLQVLAPTCSGTVFLCILLHVCLHMHVCAEVQVCIRACTCACTWVYVRVPARVPVRAHVRVGVRMAVRTGGGSSVERNCFPVCADAV